MAKLFISHSSKDKDFVRELASDLRDLGNEVWLDEWEIRVGDCIASKIEQGLEGADYVVVVLSRHAVESGWVDREWKTKYWDEVQARRTFVLPVLLEECSVPALLKTKKYADFRNGRRAGLVELALAIQPVIATDAVQMNVRPVKQGASAMEVSEIIANVHSPSVPLSQSLAQALAFANQVGDQELATFCESELVGYKGKTCDPPSWRIVSGYVSVNARINPEYIGFANNISAALDEMERDKEHFSQRKLFVSFSVPVLELRPVKDATNTLQTMELRVGDLLKDAEYPDETAIAYMRGDTYSSILVSVKTELTRRLTGYMGTKG